MGKLSLGGEIPFPETETIAGRGLVRMWRLCPEPEHLAQQPKPVTVKYVIKFRRLQREARQWRNGHLV